MFERQELDVVVVRVCVDEGKEEKAARSFDSGLRRFHARTRVHERVSFTLSSIFGMCKSQGLDGAFAQHLEVNSRRQIHSLCTRGDLLEHAWEIGRHATLVYMAR